MKFKLNLENIYILLFPLFSYSCYHYVGFDPKIIKFIYYVFISISILIFVKNFFFIKKGNYVRIVQLIVLLIFLSSINAYFFWNQNFIISFQSTSWALGIIYFFTLLSFKPKIEFIEKIVLFYAILYTILWSYAMINVPEVLFSVSEEFDSYGERGITRINLYGYTALILGLFLSLNRFLESKNKKWFYLIILFAVFIVLQLIRQVIFFSFVIAFVYIFRKRIKIVIIGLIIAILSSTFINIDELDENSVFGNMIALSKAQIENNNKDEKDIRIQEYTYFFTKYSKNTFTSIFGNGVSHSDSDLGKYTDKLVNDYKFYASDVGYAQLYIRFGFITLILYFILLYRVFKQKTKDQYAYAKLFIYYLFFANIASAPITVDAVLFAICLYILEYNFWFNKHKKKNYAVNNNC